MLTSTVLSRRCVQVVFDQSYDFVDSIALLHVETGLSLKELKPDAPEPEGMAVVEGPPVSRTILPLYASACVRGK